MKSLDQIQKIFLVLVYFALPNLTTSQCNPDIQAPTVNCLPSINIILGPSGTAILDPASIDNGSFDNCTLTQNLTLSVTPASVSCSDIGTPVMATLTITDEAGNTDDCDTEIYVQDRSLPLFNCPSNDTIILGPTGIFILTKENIVSGEASFCPLNYTISPPSVSCSDIGSPVSVMVVGTNSSGISDTCVFTLTVLDTSIPSFNCPINDTLILGPSGIVTLTKDNFVSGETSFCPLSYTISPSSVSCSDIGFPVGVMIVGTNGRGFLDTCVFTLTVLDISTPTFFCSNNETILVGPSGMISLTKDILVSGETSICPLSYTISPSFVSCSDVGSPLNVMVVGTNSVGIADTCLTIINVEDRIPPNIICKFSTNLELGAGGVVTLTPAMLTNSISDNCGLTFDISPSTLSCSDIGKNTVTITATDSGGNSASCTTEVTVGNPRPNFCMINGPSTITCNSSGILITVSTIGGNGPFTYDWTIKKGASDGWAITSGLGTDSIIMEAGTKKLDLRLTVTDVCGKKRKCKYKISCINGTVALNNTGNSQNKILIVENEFEESEFSIFPNPAKDVISVEGKMDLTGPMMIIGTNGYASIVRINKNTPFGFNISHLNPGIYYLVIKHKNNRIIKRFIKLE